MRSVAVQFAVLINAVLLALPPGWCQAVSGGCRIEHAGVKVAAAHAPAARSCCQHKRSSSVPAETPRLPAARCCCDRDSAPPPPRAQLPDDDGPALSAIVDVAVLEATPQLVAGCASPVERPVGPPLRILQCVWRC